MVHPPPFTLRPSPPLHHLPHPIRRSPLPPFIYIYRRLWNRHNEHIPSWCLPRPVILRPHHEERPLVENGRLCPLWRHIRWLTLHRLVLQVSPDSEQILWQVTSLAITVIPLIVTPIDFLLATRDISSGQSFECKALLILDLIMTILIYVPACLSLIAQALALL